MSQATRISITPLAGSSRPRLEPQRFSPLEIAHIRMVTRLAMAKPNRIIGCFAHRIEVEDRAEHLAAVMAAVVEYVSTIVTDTADLAPVGAIDRKYVTGCLADLAGEVIGGIRQAAHETEA